MASPSAVAPSSWALWRLPSAAVGYLLTAQFAALVGLGFAWRHGVPMDARLGRAGLLLFLVIGYGEACDRIERLNRYLATDGMVSNQNSVLCFASVLVLPASLAALLTIVTYLHTRIRTRRWRTTYAHRDLFNAASAVLATLLASTLFHGLGGPTSFTGADDALLVLGTIAVYTLVNIVLLVGCLRLVNREASWRSLLPSRHHVAYENSTLLFGAMAGIVVLYAPWLSVLIPFLIASLHRASLVTDLQHRARTDAKTGLLNAGGWQLLARQHLLQCVERALPAAVLLVDLDHFKSVNDTHGHLVGDEVLKSVADVLVRELRGYDAVGRYGGEEFIAILPGSSDADAVAIGERIRLRIGEEAPEGRVAVTASVGVAVGQTCAGASLEDLIDAADTALYAAKTGGRNQVRLAPPVQIRVQPETGNRRSFMSRMPDKARPVVAKVPSAD